MIDSAVGHNSINVVEYRKSLNEIHQKSNENIEMKIKKYSEKNIIFLGSKMIMNIVRSFESDQDEVRDNKNFKEDIIITRNAMITYMNSREISQPV